MYLIKLSYLSGMKKATAERVRGRPKKAIKKQSFSVCLTQNEVYFLERKYGTLTAAIKTMLND